MRLTQALHRAALVHRNGPGTSHAGRSRTWLELKSRVARLAQGLSDLGIAEGDRVAVLSFNSDFYFEAMYAVPWAGAIVVPLNTRLSVAELEYQLADSDTRVLLFDAAFELQARKLAAGNPALTLVQLDDIGDGLVWEYLAMAGDCPDAERGGDDIAGIFYTGGTTGRSKGVALNHANLLHNVMNLGPYFQFGHDTRCLHASPMFHIADALSIFGVTLHCGHHFFEPKFDAATVLNRIATDRLNYIALVPTMLKLLVEQPGLASLDLTCLTRVFYGGSAMPEAVARRTLSALPHVKFHQGYGLTETSPTISHLGPEDHGFDGNRASRMRSAGQPVATVEVTIRDTRGQPVASEAIGEICVRGPTVMREYWGNTKATAEAFFGDWFRTGDVGHFDADGYLFVVDRLKDMIISGGENIYSAEVENALLQHSAVQDCAVIGVPDEQWGERVHAILRLRDGMSASDDELLEHCRSILARYKCPRSFERANQALPLSGAGKILKSELKRQFLPA